MKRLLTATALLLATTGLASAEGRQLITDLFNHGCLYLADDEDD